MRSAGLASRRAGRPLGLLDERIDDVRLLAAREGLAQELRHARALALAEQQRCATGVRPGGSSSITETSRSPYSVSASVRGIGVAVITSTCGAGALGLAGERRALEHAEAVLLVDHHEREPREARLLLDERVRPDHQVELAGRERGADLVGVARAAPRR